MADRMLDISDEPARLSVRLDQLLIERPDQPVASVPLADLACLIVSNPQVTYTHAVLAGLLQFGGAFVVCNAKHIPVGMLLRIEGHTSQAELFRKQAAMAEPLKKRLWRQIVAAKVKAQSVVLRTLRGDDRGLAYLARQVQSGDASNIESRAARLYWPALFADPDFKRNREAPDQNRFLNYGYAVLRALVARALCGSGLHPSFGLHHHNRYDAFCLADDLMEPFRPLVDHAVVVWVMEHGAGGEMNREVKKHLLSALSRRLCLDEEWRTLFDILTRTSASLVRAIEGKGEKLALPDPDSFPGTQ